MPLAIPVDDAHRAHLEAPLFGLRLWVTAQTDWPPAAGVRVAHQQASVDAAVRQLPDPDPVAGQPMLHGTD